MDFEIEHYLNNKKLNQYLQELLLINSNINLTRVTDIDEARILHLEDSLIGLEEINNSPDGLYGDLGSGCGFPGVALSIASGRHTILIDSVKKKMVAVQTILKKLNLENQIEVLPERIENVPKILNVKFSVLTARAVSSLPSLLELATPLLSINGKFIAYKSHVDQEEIDNAKEIEELTGMLLENVYEYFLSDKKTFRSLYVFRKINKPSIKLPRRVGMAQKNPLTFK